jgi:mercuric ion transport protein
MNDRVLIRAGTAGAIIAAICCATPILAVLLPLAGLGAWLARADLLLPSLLVVPELMARDRHRRRVKAANCEMKIQKEGVKP